MQESNARVSDNGTAALEVLRDWAKGDGSESRLAQQPEAQAETPARPLEISAEDWDVLFRAVETRLASSVGEPAAAPIGSQAHDAAALVRSTVLECVAALHQLHMSLGLERDRHDSLYPKVIETPAVQASAVG